VVRDKVMKIGIDARFLMHGVGRYAEELVTHLREVDAAHTYYVFTSNSYRQAPTLNHLWGNQLREIPGRGSLYSPSGQIRIPYHVARHGLQLFHATSFQSPLIRFCPLVVTIHDQAPRLGHHLPFSTGARGIMARAYYCGMNAYAVRYARHIIAVSQQAKTDILRFHPSVPPEKISVIYHGVSASFKPANIAEQARVRARHRLPHDYFLYLGTVNPGKNLIRVLEAFDALHHTPGWRHKLVAVARTDPRYGDFYRFWEQFPGKAGVQLLDYAEKADLPGLYTGACALVFPSLHESFGFPVLEAFACGTPVITSLTSALPEIAGDAALLVNPGSVEDIAAACRRLATDTTCRQALIEKGFRRALNFSWQRCAEQTLDVYDGVLSGRLG
jgi:glycosyltransferase involved in cell wall biosynthesis